MGKNIIIVNPKPPRKSGVDITEIIKKWYIEVFNKHKNYH